MALIHEILYGSHNLACIDFKRYIRNLVSGLYLSYGIDTGRISFETNIQKISLGIDHAIPLGLIINELVTNCIKYAFPESCEAKGKIRITLKQKTEDEYELIVSDNGVGIPENFNILEAKSLGIKLITVLVQDQLNGSIQLDNEKGTKYIIHFKII